MTYPTGWADFSKEEKEAVASALLDTVRGRLILGQALAVAVLSLEGTAFPERSNIEDMRILGTLAEPFFSMYIAKVLKTAPSVLAPRSTSAN